MLSQRKKLHLTSGSALLLQIVTMICGFIIPRLFLEYYGSAVNGLISSITHFLGFIALAECGVGAVVQSALYKPLAQKDVGELSRIIVAAEHFFRNIAKLLLLYTAVLVIVYPNIISSQFEYIYTASLILIIAISTFAQYYFGITYRLLLNSDQFGFVPIVVQIVALLLNLFASIFLMKSGASVHIVKLVSSSVFLLQPLAVSFIAHRWYAVDRNVQFDKTAIPQKWNGLAQHISAVVLQSCGITVLTIFSTMEKVSVYSLYFLVICSLRNLITSLTNGYNALLGNLFAKSEIRRFQETFFDLEKKMHLVFLLIFPATAVLITPFIGVYTKGIEDADYTLPLFGVLFSVSWGFSCLQLPYKIVVLSVGHYKQTQASSFIEAILNITISVMLVFHFGLYGIAIATFVALFYRFIYLFWYVSKKIVQRTIKSIVFLIIQDVLTVALFFAVVCYLFPNWNLLLPEDFFAWGVFAVKIMAISVVVVLLLNIAYILNVIKKGKLI